MQKISPTRRRRWGRCLLGAIVLVASAGCSPAYFRKLGHDGPKEPAESFSLDTRDYVDLATLFVDKLKQSPLYTRMVQGDPFDRKTPAIAHKAFSLDISDRNTKVDVIEDEIRMAFQEAGIRYIRAQERQTIIDTLKVQHSDLNDPETRGQFGKIANAKFLLVGKLTESTTILSRSEKKREFHLYIDLLDIETLDSRFQARVHVTKYMES